MFLGRSEFLSKSFEILLACYCALGEADRDMGEGDRGVTKKSLGRPSRTFAPGFKVINRIDPGVLLLKKIFTIMTWQIIDGSSASGGFCF